MSTLEPIFAHLRVSLLEKYMGAPRAPPPAPLHRNWYGGAWGGLQLEGWGALGRVDTLLNF